MKSEKILVIGGVAAGTKAAAKARRENPALEIVIITRERHVSYAGCGLPYYIGGVIQEEKELLVRSPEGFLIENNIKVITGTEAIRISPAEKTVLARDLASGETKEHSYDRLILATGASPFIPSLRGKELGNIFSLRTVTDASAIKKLLSGRDVRDAVVAGGGLIGLEVAENLSRRGINTTVVELAPQILPPYDPEIALQVENYLRSKGVNIHTGTSVNSFEDNGNGEVGAVLTSAGLLKADLVVISAGVRPNVELARECGIELGRTGAIAANKRMETNLKDIYAVGDCTENFNLITGRPVWYPMGSTANKAGRVAGINISQTGIKDTLEGVLGTSVIKLFDLNAAKTGLSEKEARETGFDVETVLVPSPDRAHYYPGYRYIVTKLIADRKNRRVLGAQIYGEGIVDKPIDIIATAITFGSTVDMLAKLDLAYAPPFSSAMSTTLVTANVMLNKLAGKFTGISPLELKGRLEAGAILVDVRTPEEYFVRAIPGSLNIPLHGLTSRNGELGRDQEIILSCRVGARAYTALLKLKELGFEKLSILEGGITAYPFETE